MNAKQRNDIVEAVSGIVGAIALVGLVALVYTGRAPFDQAAPIIIGIVSAAGVYESGRRRGKKAQALEAVFEMAEDFMGGDSGQSSSGSSETSSTSSSGTSGNPGDREPPSADGEYFAPKDSDSSSESDESDEQLDQLVAEAQDEGPEASSESTTTDGKSPSQRRGEWLATAGYQDCRRVASQIPGINGNQSKAVLRERLRAADPERVLEAIQTTEGK